jgi:hypothetical protein
MHLGSSKGRLVDQYIDGGPCSVIERSTFPEDTAKPSNRNGRGLNFLSWLFYNSLNLIVLIIALFDLEFFPKASFDIAL